MCVFVQSTWALGCIRNRFDQIANESNSAHSPRASEAKCESLPPIAKLCYCYVAESAKQKYIMSSASPAEIYLNTIFGCIWSSWGTFYQGVGSITHLSCGCICHRICIEAMGVWKPESGVHLAVQARDIASKTKSCLKSLGWIYLPQCFLDKQASVTHWFLLWIQQMSATSVPDHDNSHFRLQDSAGASRSCGCRRRGQDCPSTPWSHQRPCGLLVAVGFQKLPEK